jgi:hypothetical protein
MAGLESLRTPREVAELRGLSINAVLGLADPAANADEFDGVEVLSGAPDADVDAADVADESAEVPA